MRRLAADAGVSIIEVTVSASILISGVLAVVLTMSHASGQALANRDRLRAVEAARSALERARELPFDEVFARLNEPGSDDPGGSGTAEGAGFAVEGLSATLDDADGLPGRFVFPIVISTDALSETPNNAFQGIARDLNGDGDATDADVSGTYRMLPITAVVEWRSVVGDMSVEMTTVLRGTR